MAPLIAMFSLQTAIVKRAYSPVIPIKLSYYAGGDARALSLDASGSENMLR